MADTLRVLVLTSVFPNASQPALGVFVRERVQRMSRSCDLRVVAAVPWFPGNRFIRGARWSNVPTIEDQEGLPVYHPRILSIPRYGKALDGVFYAASLMPFLLRLRRAFPFDLIDAHFVYPDGVAAIVLGKAFRVPVTITLRGSIVRLSTYRWHRPQIRWALQRAARIIAVSQSLKTVVTHLGIPPERIRVIPNGVDSERFRRMDRTDARRACGLPLDRTILLSVGAVYAGKGHHLVVEALRRLVQRWPDLLYVVVGDEMHGDNYRLRLEQTIASYGLEPHVRFIGGRPHEDLPPWFAAADVFCLATRSEGWANVLLESIACGVPVVTTRVGGNAEIVRERIDGVLVPLGHISALASAIDEALTRSWDRDAMATYARGHSWDRAAAAALEELQAARSAEVGVQTVSRNRRSRVCIPRS